MFSQARGISLFESLTVSKLGILTTSADPHQARPNGARLGKEEDRVSSCKDSMSSRPESFRA